MLIGWLQNFGWILMQHEVINGDDDLSHTVRAIKIPVKHNPPSRMFFSSMASIKEHMKTLNLTAKDVVRE